MAAIFDAFSFSSLIIFSKKKYPEINLKPSAFFLASSSFADNLGILVNNWRNANGLVIRDALKPTNHMQKYEHLRCLNISHENRAKLSQTNI